MQIKGFLFDVDGVLFDSMPQHAKSWIVAFKEKGIRLPAKHVYLLEGMTEVEAVVRLADAVNVKLSEADQDDIVERKRFLFNQYKNPKLTKGAKRLFDYLKQKKFKVGIVTGSNQTKTVHLIKHNFSVSKSQMVTGADVVHGKPDPEPYLAGLKKINLKPEQVLVVENAPLGIESARRAGIRVVALKTGLLSAKELKKCDASWVFNNCAEVLKKIDTIVQ